jgi:hypothetical protein
VATLPWGSTGPGLVDGRERWQAMLREPVQPKRRYGKGHFLLTRDQIIASRRLAEEIGTHKAAARYKVSPSTLHRAWRREGVATPGRRVRVNQPVLTRDQVIAARQLAVRVGNREAGRRFGVARPTIERLFRYYDLPRDRRGQRPRARRRRHQHGKGRDRGKSRQRRWYRPWRPT